MKNLVYVLVALLLVVTSCNKTEVPAEEQRVDVGFEIVQGDYTAPLGLKSAGPYDRGYAPVYVSGLVVGVNNTTYPGNDFSKTFDFMNFETPGGDAMVVENVTVGNNTFTAFSMAEYAALNAFYEIDRIPETGDASANVYNTIEDADSFEDRAYHYSMFLDDEHPLYMKFTGVENQFIAMDQTNMIAFDLQATHSRINIILESVPDYKAKMMVQTKDGLVEATSFACGDDAVAIVLNDDQIREMYGDVQIYFDFYDAEEHELGYEMKSISIVNGSQITRVYKYNGAGMQEATIMATYEPIVPDNGGENL